MIQPLVKIPLTARDQGKRGSCVAFSLAGIKGNLTNFQLSPEYAYLATAHQSPDWQPNQGLDVRVAIRATGAGLPEDLHCPYQEDEPKRPLPALPEGLHLHGPDMMLKLPDLDVAKSWLNDGKPVGTLIALTPSFMSPQDGVVSFESQAFPGLHAVVIVGFGNDSAGDEHYLICNSWGSSWGIEGHAWLPRIYLDQHATCIYGAAP